MPNGQRGRGRLAGLLVGLYMGTCSAISYGASMSVKSPQTQIDLLELYTSEGCYSCPPADRWVSKLEKDPGLWKHFIPVAFHVDYWDYIGWPDRFASPAFTARQQTYAAEQGMRTVYTPGFFLNGMEWRWRSRHLGEETENDAAGVLSLDVSGETAKVGFEVDEPPRDLSVNIALLGFGIETDVAAGENSGKTLTHNFVVLSIEQAPLSHDKDRYTGVLPVPQTGIEAERYALVAWVNQTGMQAPVQAVGGFLANHLANQ